MGPTVSSPVARLNAARRRPPAPAPRPIAPISAHRPRPSGPLGSSRQGSPARAAPAVSATMLLRSVDGVPRDLARDLQRPAACDRRGCTAAGAGRRHDLEQHRRRRPQHDAGRDGPHRRARDGRSADLLFTDAGAGVVPRRLRRARLRPRLPDLRRLHGPRGARGASRRLVPEPLLQQFQCLGLPAGAPAADGCLHDERDAARPRRLRHLRRHALAEGRLRQACPYDDHGGRALVPERAHDRAAARI